MTLELPPDVEGALAAEAAPPPPPTPREDPTLALFARWEAEYATDDPEELARRQREGDELMAALDADGRMTSEGRTDFSGLLDLDAGSG